MIDLSLTNDIYINDELDEALQELDILFGTECTELINDTNFGVSMYQFLWTLTPMTDSMREYVSSKLKECTYLNMFRYDFDVKYYDENFNSLYHLTINIYLNDNQQIKKEYDFK